MSELPLKATLKAGREFSDPWLTVDGQNPDDLKFKLDAIQISGVLDSLVGAANMLKAVNAVGDANGGQSQQATPQAQPQQNQGWGAGSQNPTNQPQQAAPQQQQGQSRYGGQLHPEGKQCNCGKVLEKKQTSGGKQTWRCPDWRWNNGSPNGHDSEFIN